MRRLRALAGFSLGALAALAACGPQNTTGVYIPPNLSQAEFTQLVASTWDALQAAPWVTPYSGERTVEFTVPSHEDVPVTIRYRERIVTDGEGGFTIEPLQAETPVFPDEATFLLLQAQREAFYFRYRDFAIRDGDRLLENFQVVGDVLPVTIAGRACQEVQIVRRVSGGRHYRIAFDVETGVPLRYVEYDDNVEEIARMEFDSVDFAPTFDGVPFHIPSNAEVELDLADASDTFRHLGFAPREPGFVPAGFGLFETAKVEDVVGRRWLKLGYTDGVEVLFLLHREVVNGQYALPTTLPTKGTKRHRDEVMVFTGGPMTVVQGTLGDHEFIAVGEIDDSSLLRMLDSARE